MSGEFVGLQRTLDQVRADALLTVERMSSDRMLLRLLTLDEWPENSYLAFGLLDSAAYAIVGRAVLGEDRPQTVADVARHANAGWDQYYADRADDVPAESVTRVTEEMVALRQSARRHGLGPMMDEQRRRLREENQVGSGDPMWMWGEPDGAS